LHSKLALRPGGSVKLFIEGVLALISHIQPRTNHCNTSLKGLMNETCRSHQEKYKENYLLLPILFIVIAAPTNFLNYDFRRDARAFAERLARIIQISLFPIDTRGCTSKAHEQLDC